MVRRVNNMFMQSGVPLWYNKMCLNCDRPFKTIRKNKNCCSSKCHEELVKKQKEKRKKI